MYQVPSSLFSGIALYAIVRLKNRINMDTTGFINVKGIYANSMLA
jgi:hypothetical protein